jgi:hypothetical protein
MLSDAVVLGEVPRILPFRKIVPVSSLEPATSLYVLYEVKSLRGVKVPGSSQVLAYIRYT